MKSLLLRELFRRRGRLAGPMAAAGTQLARQPRKDIAHRGGSSHCLLALAVAGSLASADAIAQHCERVRQVGMQCYEAPADVEQRVNIGQARKAIRSLRGTRVLLHSKGSEFDATQVKSGYSGFSLHGSGGSLTVNYAAMLWEPIAAIVTSQAMVGLTGSDAVSFPAARFDHASRIVDAVVVLRRAAQREHAPWADERFSKIAENYRNNPKPEVPGELRQSMTEVQAAVRRKDFEEAIDLLSEIVDRAPWWPVGRWNLAVALAELGDTPSAVHHLKRFLQLVPEGPDSKAARDLISRWGG